MYFVPKAEWQQEECLRLEHPVEGLIILDILQRNRDGGAEFIKYVPPETVGGA